ncbi:MAG TPA: tetratricopeptide repeat protein [Vicinamibacterales bacterium]|nr:tetratricopeptide repeat protein [Vicinamibacterales bacterium]
MQIRTTLLALSLALPIGATNHATSSAASSWDALAASIESAARAGRSDELRGLRASCLKLLTTAPADREPLLRYAAAYVGWRLAVLPDVPKHEVPGLLDDAVEHLRVALKKNDRFAEAHALLGGVYGLQIGASPWKGITLGPRASSAIGRAAELEPDNPRVLLQQGISAFHSPAMFGGGPAKAEAHLRRSLERFEQEPAGRAWPNWGRVDAHAWLGQVLQKRGDLAGARRHFDAALALAPENGWVRYVLLPRLDKAQKR